MILKLNGGMKKYGIKMIGFNLTTRQINQSILNKLKSVTILLRIKKI
jgi:hypothetical protein